MRLPRSLFGRLLGLSAITTLAALAFAGLSIGQVLDRFVMHGFDQQLDAEIAMLARALRGDGTLDAKRIVDLPAFADRRSGWGWRIDAPARTWTRGEAPRAPLLNHDLAPPQHHHDPHPREAMGLEGEALHLRTLNLATAVGSVTITASGPARIARAPLREAMVPLITSLVVLGLALAVATALQLRIGLKPLRTLAAALAAVRAGQLRHIPLDQPAEIAPLAVELNALIDQNAVRLDHARRHVANLAHGLKTPLAALAMALAEGQRDPDGTLGEMVARIDRRVRHYLARARAAAPGGGQRARTPLAPAVADLVTVLAKIHTDRSIAATLTIADDCAVAVDAQDLDEMLGNLLDNGWRHARAAVAVTAFSEDGLVTIAIEEDGAGLAEAVLADALIPGRRIDEQGDGHGFGLSIVTELAELNGGTLTLGRSVRLGGLRATLVLPA